MGTVCGCQETGSGRSRGEAETDVERGGGRDVFEAGVSADDSGGEGAAADGSAGL